MDKNFQAIALDELRLLLQPLADAAGSEDLRRDLLRGLGWDIDRIDGFPIGSLSAALQNFANAHQQFSALIDSPPEGLKGLADTLLATEQIVFAAIHLNQVFTGPASPEGFSALGKELVDYLTIVYLRVHHPFTYHLLYLLTVIDDAPALMTAHDGQIVRDPVARRTLRLGQIPALLGDPVGTLKAEYGLTNGISDPAFTSDKLFPRLLFFVEETGAQGWYGLNPDVQVDFGPAGNEIAARSLTIFRPLPDEGDTRTLGIGTGISLSSELGVVLRPLGSFEFSERFERWALSVRGVVQAEGVAVDSQAVTLPEGASGGISIEAEAVRLPERDASGNSLAFLVGSTTGTRLEVGDFAVGTHANLAPGALDFGFQIDLRSARFVISSGDGDGFIQEVLPSEIPIDFDLGLGWSKRRGLHFSIGAGLSIVLPVHVSLAGVLDIDSIQLEIRTDGQLIDLAATATFTAHIGSVLDVIAQQTGLKGVISFPAEGGGNLGPLDFDLAFQLPRGLGIVVHAGPVTGGGFIFLDPGIGRYSGALELSVFGVGVKAFGIVDTIFPDGSRGFSFVIVIVAEFTPIQLGFGFTLVGVGGLIAVNRSVNADALGEAARSGSLAHLLFPRNPVADAPAILHDLGSVFPPARGRTIVGPMAKLGWGTPTLITADLGILIEFPGPRIAVLGVVRMRLPSPEFAVLSLQLAVAGWIDFPAKLFSLDAGLFDSYVAGFAVSGDMAFRLGLGDNAQFLLSVGGFNSGFAPPPRFPELRRASVDLGVNGNPSLTASGYFALTSNTAQVGASIELRASGYGIRLNGWLGFDVLFVFSPFSFTASISAGVRVSFHGVGMGITLRGSLSGPTPWRLNGKVCVSVLWWDACLPVNLTFGRAEPAALPELDPWDVPLGTPASDDPRLDVARLRPAITDPRNWSGSAPPASFNVITLAPAATLDRTPIDPMGSATLRQRVLPLGRVLQKFGEYKPITHDRFFLASVTLNGEELVATVEDVLDDFAPAAFEDLSSAEKLAAGSYDEMVAGFEVAPDRVESGAAGQHSLDYETVLITETGERVEDDAPFRPTHEQLLAMLERSAAALGGIRQAGVRRYMPPLDRPKLVTLARPSFVVVDACSHAPNLAITPTGTTRTNARQALRAHTTANPLDPQRFTIVPVRAA